jgi:hypothetical protein
VKALRDVLAALRLSERLADPDWHPTPEEVAEAQHALAQAPSRPQAELPLAPRQ